MAKCKSEPPPLCHDISPAEGPEQVIYFRQPAPIEPLTVSLGEPGEHVLEFACTPVDVGGITGDLSLDLRYQQWWFYQRLVTGALSASVALAPAETLALSVRNTQRKQFDQQTIDEVERSEQSESTIADKDVLNVTRSASQTNNWTVSGNASITLPEGGSAGVTGSISETVAEASSSSAQRTRESTQKAASNLKTVQKIQVREFTEVTTEAATSRKITNPYRDRSVRLDVYELAKVYCVEFHLTEIVPILVFDLHELVFDRQFVLTNMAFLSDELIDRLLELELSQALQITTDLRLEGAEERAQRTALLALDYLFAGPVMFNLPTVGLERSDFNDPGSSFVEPFEGWSGLIDATEHNVGVIFSTLAFYYQLYRQEVLPSTDGQLAIGLAMSLDQVIASRWVGGEETSDIQSVLEPSQATEVMRRLGGFLTMTSGILRPLLQPAEEEREARSAAERAEFVITRAIKHLQCHARYYTERYLHYMADKTQMRTVFRFIEDVLTFHLRGVSPSVQSWFDPEAAFLDGSRIVVPLRLLPSDELDDLLKALDPDGGNFEPGQLDTQQLTVPTDGVHLEPAAGECVLSGISAEPIAGPVHVAVDQE